MSASKRSRWFLLCAGLCAGLCLAGGIGSGCFSRAIAQNQGTQGWFRADRQPSRPDAYSERFEPVALADGIPCEDLTRRLGDPSKPIIVLVHGVGGDREEMEASLPVLMAATPASVFMFRWVPYDERDVIAGRLAKGISHLAACIPEAHGRLLVLAHSAGGVLASHAASRLDLPASKGEGPWLTILTVAAPLAGTVSRAGKPNGKAEPVFFLDLGTHIRSYPVAVPGARVVHLRTHAPADTVMTPDKDLFPNDPSVGVPGAPQIDLPEGLTHPGSLEYVAAEIAAGRWTLWRDGAEPTTTARP